MNRKHELFLINLGLETLLDKMITEKINPRIPWNKGIKSERKWSKDQHKKFSATMKKVWEEKKKKQALK